MRRYEDEESIDDDSMGDGRKLTFFHSPNSRSAGVFTLLEELGAPYELQILNMKAGRTAPAALPGGQPADGQGAGDPAWGALVTEQPAIFVYLGDLFPEAGLAPAIGDPLRGPDLRWLVYYGSSFEPAPRQMCPYGDYDTMLSTPVGQLAKGPYLLGDRFTAADILWGTALAWMTMFKLVPELPETTAYIQRIAARPSVAKVKAKRRRARGRAGGGQEHALIRPKMTGGSARSADSTGRDLLQGRDHAPLGCPR